MSHPIPAIARAAWRIRPVDGDPFGRTIPNMFRTILLAFLGTTLLQAEDRWVDARSNESGTFKARPTRTLDGFPNVAAVAPEGLTRYGGLAAEQQEATGRFRIAKIGDRWWMIDPEGGRFVFQGVCSLRSNSDPAVELAAALDLLRSASFNGVGGFSDHETLRAAEHPLPYTVTLNLMSGFGGKLGLTHAEAGHTGYEDDCIPVFEPGFEAHCLEVCRERLSPLKDDPWLVGVFSDNELPVPEDLLDRMRKRPGASGAAAEAFLQGRGEITDEMRQEFIEQVFDAYFRITTTAIRQALPDHLCLGSRFHGRALRMKGAWKAAGRWCDAVSVNYYGYWSPQSEHLENWHRWSGKPCLVTEFYVKAVDSGLPNTTGAGWLVKTQADRGAFYQNFTLALLESKTCVGWHWFKYQDNDPSDPKAEASNRDSNKGIVNLRGEPYGPLLEAMRALNTRVHPLIEHFDAAVPE
ncbi:MAG: hypothetical protein JNK37_07890 [Verrucomicrobiales bacterium]|nr:hypothetical protein [Verrucomicrobiales bacterium]